jgi:hypothetical protein
MEQMAELGSYCAGNPWLAFPYHGTNGVVEGQSLATWSGISSNYLDFRFAYASSEYWLEYSATICFDFAGR